MIDRQVCLFDSGVSRIAASRQPQVPEMRQTIGFLFFMLFLAGLAFAMLKNLRSTETLQEDGVTIIAGDWMADAVEASSDQATFVRFHADGKISGFAGCNRFFGTFVATDSTIEISALGATRMACADPVMRQETVFLESLQSATTYGISGHLLILRLDEQKLLSLKLRESGTK